MGGLGRAIDIITNNKTQKEETMESWFVDDLIVASLCGRGQSPSPFCMLVHLGTGAHGAIEGGEGA